MLEHKSKSAMPEQKSSLGPSMPEQKSDPELDSELETMPKVHVEKEPIKINSRT